MVMTCLSVLVSSKWFGTNGEWCALIPVWARYAAVEATMESPKRMIAVFVPWMLVSLGLYVLASSHSPIINVMIPD
jgi:hypothetical protein